MEESSLHGIAVIILPGETMGRPNGIQGVRDWMTFYTEKKKVKVSEAYQKEGEDGVEILPECQNFDYHNEHLGSYGGP